MKTPDNIYTKNLIVNDRYDIGDFTYGNPRIYDWDEGVRLKIGKYTSIADEVVILLGGNHRTDWVSTYPFPAYYDVWPEAEKIKGHRTNKGDVVMGNDVWIGNGAMIMSGVTIGDGAVIAARAVVTKDIAPYTVVAGVPAKKIKTRFSRLEILHLLEIEWWNWPREDVRESLDLICSRDIKALRKKHAEYSNFSYTKHSIKMIIILILKSLSLPVPKRKRLHDSLAGLRTKRNSK